MFRRVEICFPVENKKLQNRILQDLNLYLNDNTQAWLLQSDGSYQRLQKADADESIQAQAVLMHEVQ
jgi:polyphosphate kinase